MPRERLPHMTFVYHSKSATECSSPNHAVETRNSCLLRSTTATNRARKPVRITSVNKNSFKSMNKGVVDRRAPERCRCDRVATELKPQPKSRPWCFQQASERRCG